MLRKLFKGAAYAKSPKRAFAMYHPMRAAKYGAAIWVFRKLFGGKSDKREAKAKA